MFWLKYECSHHNVDFSSKNVISYESGEKYAQIKHSFQVKTVQSSSKQMLVGFDVRGEHGMDFFTGRWINDYGLLFWSEAAVKTPE